MTGGTLAKLCAKEPDRQTYREIFVKHAIWLSSATLTDIFPCFFLSCEANARVTVKQFHYRRGQAQRVPGSECIQIS